MPDDQSMHHGPWVLPGGTHILFSDIPIREATGEPYLAIYSIEDGSTERFELGGVRVTTGQPVVGIVDGMLVFEDQSTNLMATLWDEEARRPIGEPIAVPGAPSGWRAARMSSDGTLVMLVGVESYELVLANLDGTERRILPDETVTEMSVRFSRDGSRIAFGARLRGEEEAWLYDVERDQLSQLPVGYRPRSLDWTADDRRLVTASGPIRASQAGVHVRAADASDQLTTFVELSERRIAAAALHPNTDALAIVEQVRVIGSPQSGILVMDSPSDPEPDVFADAPSAREVAPRFSPDGRWLAYSSNESGRFQVYVRPYPGSGARTQVSDEVGGQPVWSGSGGTLYYRTDRAIWAADIDYEGDRAIVTGRRQVMTGEFAGDPDETVAMYDVRPDGRTFIVARAPEGSSPRLVVWRDWWHDLKALLEAQP